MVLQGISFLAVTVSVGVLLYKLYKNLDMYSYNRSPAYSVYNLYHNSEKPRKLANSETCSICMEQVHISSESAISLPCSHQFHRKCVEPWLNLNRSCPNCRACTVSLRR